MGLGLEIEMDFADLPIGRGWRQVQAEGEAGSLGGVWGLDVGDEGDGIAAVEEGAEWFVRAELIIVFCEEGGKGGDFGLG